MDTEFEVPSEPKMSSANAIQDKFNGMMLYVYDDLQDEIGTRQEQFDSISKTCDDLRSRITLVNVDMIALAKRNKRLAIIGVTIGVLSICANMATILFL